MDRLNILLVAFCALSFIAFSIDVLYMTCNNSTFIYKQGRNSTGNTMTQATHQDEDVLFHNGNGVESIPGMNLERQATVKEFCKKYHRVDERINTKYLDNIIVDEKFKILFCYIPKVSCSQWKTVLARLHRPEPKYYIQDPRNFKFLNNYPTDYAERMVKTYFKFVFVREPFERLLSAYLEKFYSGDPAFHKRYAREILRKYRPGKKPEDKNITFDEFVNYVINIGDGYWNEHWQTYDKLCHPCGIHYDFIGRFKNLEDEARYVLELTNVSRKLNVSFPQVKPSSTSSKVPFFYSQIPKERLKRVVQLFGGDSEMFGYDLPKYLFSTV